VAKERLKSPRARLFVALDLPEPARAGLVAWQTEALGDPALRAIPPQALHVTLCFLGYHPEREIERIAQVVRGVRVRPVTMRFEAEPIAAPRSRPGLFAVDAPSEGAVALRAELSDRLEAERLYRPEKRPFWPHVTVARVRAEKRSRAVRGRRRPRVVERPPGRLPESLLDGFSAARVTLYRSHLRQAGAEYVSLAALGLPSDARG
jgi:RNA 2',3'-cyclic 3'-phosphodiesterase